MAKTSITELEFLYGVLLRPLPAKATPNRVSNAFVYLRTDEYYEHMDPEERKRFYDGDDKKFEKLKALKVRAARRCTCQEPQEPSGSCATLTSARASPGCSCPALFMPCASSCPALAHCAGARSLSLP